MFSHIWGGEVLCRRHPRAREGSPEDVSSSRTITETPPPPALAGSQVTVRPTTVGSKVGKSVSWTLQPPPRPDPIISKPMVTVSGTRPVTDEAPDVRRARAGAAPAWSRSLLGEQACLHLFSFSKSIKNGPWLPSFPSPAPRDVLCACGGRPFLSPPPEIRRSHGSACLLAWWSRSGLCPESKPSLF